MLPPDWDAAARETMAMLPHGRDNILNSWKDGKPGIIGTNLTCTQLRHPVLAKAFLTFNAHFFYNSTLSARVRELLILRIGWLRRAEYEYVAHIPLGKRAGLTDVELLRVELGPDAEGWDESDADLLRAADELCRDASIGDATYARLAARFDDKQLLDIVFAVGCYEVLAMMLNTFRVEFEPIAQRLDPARRARMGQ
jgi:alkylhydroperoxidase family enzyme